MGFLDVLLGSSRDCSQFFMDFSKNFASFLEFFMGFQRILPVFLSFQDLLLRIFHPSTKPSSLLE